MPPNDHRVPPDPGHDGDPASQSFPDPTIDGDETVPFEAPGTAGDDPAGSRPMGTPRTIGPYRILAVLGEGGMGSVYLAEQRHPVRRKVALKVIKLGMDTKAVMARFESERQALAMMDHPGIAKVFDAGATDQGRPYFVMEHVQGVRITTYCDLHCLDNRERLRLFIKICTAIQHAHQKGIIHRDIKPSNIMVTLQDGQPTPKIIDFGVAKATTQRLTEQTYYTELGQLIGTPEYMSPEQAEMTGLNVDTTTDIYSLGVLLYELVSGTLPYDPTSLRSLGRPGVPKQIRELSPPRPSAKFKTLTAGAAADIAARRQTNVLSLHKQLAGDLDWIILRAIEKDRTRRYPTASELAADVARHLNDEPVAARPPSKIYHLKKTVIRNKAAFAFAATIFLLLAAFGVWMSVLYGRAREAERKAGTEAAVARQVADFLQGLFEVSDPHRARGETMTAREILDRGADRIRREPIDEPEVSAALMNTLGIVYMNLGLYESAKPFLDDALAARRQLPGAFPDRTAESENALGEWYFYKGGLDSAEVLLRNALNTRRASRSTDNLGLAKTLDDLGWLLLTEGNMDEAEMHFRESLTIRRRLLSPEHPQVAVSLDNMGWLLQQKGDLAGAETYSREALALKRKILDPNDPELANSYNGLAAILRAKGDYQGAEPLFRAALAIQAHAFSERHLMTAITANRLGDCLVALARFEEAEPLLVDSYPRIAAARGADDEMSLVALQRLINLYDGWGKPVEADRYRAELANVRTRANESSPLGK
jgi:serine/threonine protein kinase/Tfp pilus assembly protein PilF